MRPSPFNGDVLPLHVADLTQSFVEGSCKAGVRFKHANTRSPRRSLRLSGDRSREDTESQHNDERAEDGHSTSLIAASACSSQNRMSISRYIVVAVVRCSRACSRWPVRR
jgi:hypothetical protein